MANFATRNNKIIFYKTRKSCKVVDKEMNILQQCVQMLKPTFLRLFHEYNCRCCNIHKKKQTISILKM